jgi:hypothetical protein
MTTTEALGSGTAPAAADPANPRHPIPRRVEPPNHRPALTTRDGVTIAVGLAGVVAWLFTAYLLWDKVSVQDPDWSRYVLIFEGFKAFAFAAGGFFFGSKLGEEKAKQAESNAKEAQDETLDAIEKKATIGTMLDALIDEVRSTSSRKGDMPLDELVAKLRIPGLDADAIMLGLPQEQRSSAVRDRALPPDRDWQRLLSFAEKIEQRAQLVR